MADDGLDARLGAARAAIRMGEWRRALEVLDAADPGESAEFLQLRAEAAYGAGEFETCVSSWEDLHSLFVARRDPGEAARAAAMIAMYLMMDTGLMAPVRGWLRCADRHLDGSVDHPAAAIIAMVRAYERFMCGSVDEAREQAAAAIELGNRFDVLPAVVIGRTCTGRVTILDGDVELGLEMLDEVGALLMSGAADPLTTGMMYCEIICAAQGLLRHDLAAQWTDVMDRWRHGVAYGGINGRCRVHRAEVLRVSGTCAEAEAEALAACDELRPWMRREFGWPLVELGNIRLRGGDLAGAEQAFQEASNHAWSPQPGWALVRLASGDQDEALAMILDAIEHPVDIPSKERPPFGPLRLVPLLDALGQIAFALRAREHVARAAGELAVIHDTYPSPMLHAQALLADSRLAILDGDSRRAVDAASGAVARFNTVGAPFDAAMARTVLARAHVSEGQPELAALERRAAHDAFASFGAVFWADRVGDEAGIATPTPVPLTGPMLFRAGGAVRTIGRGDATVVVKDLKGLRYVARLLAEPNREFHAVDLVRWEAGGDRLPGVGTGLPMLDEAARNAYRRRLADIEEDIADARAANDPVRVELAERDRWYLVEELKRATGFGGRSRQTGDDAERARVSVTRSIRYAIDRIAPVCPDIADHLDRHVRTGAFCAYESDSLQPVRWIV
jgi:tetratricopeptide (TPR) repeat protein